MSQPARSDGTGRADGLRAGAVVAAAVAQVVGSPLGTALAGRSVGEVSDATRSLITPAGYAFSIWGVLFAGALAWAVWQALPGQRGREVHRATGWPLAAAFAGNAVWEVLFPLVGERWPVLPAVLLAAIVLAAATAWARLQRLPTSGAARVLPSAVTGLLLGWVALAMTVQVASAGVALGAPAEGAAARAWAVAALVAVAGVVAVLVLTAQVAAGPLAAAAAWGLVAVAVAGPPLPVVVAALAAAGVVVAALALRSAGLGRVGRPAGGPARPRGRTALLVG
ncbi:tryptophan-rich sensory protein [Geodermatophilus marinus]|uniref:tryptophan-rich sensory protein n=1 Tax=Geodermatophilus sp. LHW52908 TaxID=2303986 RepID=UPI000E3E3DB3|nr:tryptophan-rich sensory protein [Geodermatophilus sp. LHW52908]RFU21439.1 tryptophan-rich sensory protein [Geodermatophilus sp. LHW52908]